MKLSSSRSFQRSIGVAPAFTLVEMLIVITIMTVLLTIGALGLKNMATASGVSSGIPIAESIFAEARSLAISKGIRTRVLIHAEEDHTDELHRERFLRYMVVQLEELDEKKDAGGNPTGEMVPFDPPKFKDIASKGVKLPKGVYFSKALSDYDSAGDSKTGGQSLDSKAVKLPGQKSSESSDCFYYEFNAEGIVVNPEIGGSDGGDVPRFVIVSGTLPPGAGEPQVKKGKNAGGFVIWRRGTTSVFRRPEQIDPQEKILK